MAVMGEGGHNYPDSCKMGDVESMRMVGLLRVCERRGWCVLADC